MMAFIPEASATSFEYAFSPGATLTFADGNVECLTGTFTVNMAGPTLTQADDGRGIIVHRHRSDGRHGGFGSRR